MRIKHVPHSDANQVIRLVWPFLVVILILVTLAVVSIDIMSSLRAYIGAESVWSKGEKDATFFLHLYAETGDEVLYQRHAEAMGGLLHLRRARDILDRTKTDMHTAQDELVMGGFARSDVVSAAWVYRIFRHVSYLKDAMDLWKLSDVHMDKLQQVAGQLHRRFSERSEADAELVELQEEIFQINEKVAPLSRGFSYELSATFRKVAWLLLMVDLWAATVLMLLTVWHVRRLVIQRRLTEMALRRSEARAKATLGSIGEAVIATSLSGEIEFINPAAERILCTTSAWCLGRPFSDAFSLLYERSREPEKILAKLASDGLLGDDLDDQFVEMILVSQGGVEVNVRAVVSRITGSPFYLSDLGGSNDGHQGYVIILRNMTREKEYIRSLAWQASHDSLTDLVNRLEFERQLAASLAEVRHVNAAVCDVLLVFDLDRFKIVNDTCGHAAGDGMLCAISTHLSGIFRAGDTFGRLGGDEFGALLRGYDRAQAMALADELLRSANTFCYQWEAQQFKTSLSIGLLVLDEPDITAESAMHLTDIACFVAKERGRDRIQEADLNDSDLATHANEASWARRLKHALEHDLFCLYAQPIRNLHTGDQQTGGLNKVELLLRMIDAQGGPAITPDKFIPAAERYGLMTAIDRWVVRTALRALSRTPAKQYSEYAINLSGASVGDSRFLHYVVEQIRENGIAAGLLCFEITETAAIGNLLSAVHFMNELSILGCHFALDDFGAGMSSFGYLKHLPVDYLKIDGAFIKNLPQDTVSQEMVIAINDIGHSLGCQTIAEYVENADIIELLKKYGVDYAQGYFIGRPSPWAEPQRLNSVEPTLLT
ncbi:bifunctional diguanylate cyclase/phosphodiesterase [Burkholderia sp. S171]|uniref:putative bifunctional diguanylate cyclase/phosphodiesterase n=1 Tax=Burkholderia sp. S171 TaxID=1641860 RepID=UPI00131D0081|nr:EAL domain-containing protein [Burkholderia sp. S171]